MSKADKWADKTAGLTEAEALKLVEHEFNELLRLENASHSSQHIPDLMGMLVSCGLAGKGIGITDLHGSFQQPAVQVRLWLDPANDAPP